MLEVKNIKMKFGDFTAVDDLSFEIKDGEILGLLGANGAGKTTTFRMIMNILKPVSGEVLYNGKPFTINESDKLGFMAEERAVLTKFTVENQLRYFAELKGLKVKDIDPKIDYWLERLNLLDRKKSKIKELSKGNQQKIQLISAVLHEPKLVILDEPFSGLDPFNVELFRQVILELKEKGASIIFSSHRLNDVEFFSKDIIVLIKGKVAMRGEVQKIKENSSLHKVVIECDLTKEDFKALDYVKDAQTNKGKSFVYLNNVDDRKRLFDFVKNANCTQFNLELPTLEEIFVREIGDGYES